MQMAEIIEGPGGIGATKRRRSRLSRPRHVRLALVKVANDLRDGLITPPEANALTRTLQAILQAQIEGEMVSRVEAIEKALQEGKGAAE